MSRSSTPTSTRSVWSATDCPGRGGALRSRADDGSAGASDADAAAGRLGPRVTAGGAARPGRAGHGGRALPASSLCAAAALRKSASRSASVASIGTGQPPVQALPPAPRRRPPGSASVRSSPSRISLTTSTAASTSLATSSSRARVPVTHRAEHVLGGVRHPLHPRQPQEAAGALDGVHRAEDAAQQVRVVRTLLQQHDLLLDTQEVLVRLGEELPQEIIHTRLSGWVAAQHASPCVRLHNENRHDGSRT